MQSDGVRGLKRSLSVLLLPAPKVAAGLGIMFRSWDWLPFAMAIGTGIAAALFFSFIGTMGVGIH
jgi:hypothetical protein